MPALPDDNQNHLRFSKIFDFFCFDFCQSLFVHLKSCKNTLNTKIKHQIQKVNKYKRTHVRYGDNLIIKSKQDKKNVISKKVYWQIRYRQEGLPLHRSDSNQDSDYIAVLVAR